MSLADTMRARKAALEEKRNALLAELDNDGAEARSLADIDADIRQVETDLPIVTRRLADLEAEERKAEQAAEVRTVTKTPVGDGVITREPSTYRRFNEGGANGPSYFRDFWRATTYGDRDAIDRLQRNDREARAGMTSVDNAGGEFVPPLWMISDYIAYARPGRVVANQLVQRSLPGGTDTISLPRVATGTAVAEQTTQNTALQQTDATTDSVSASVATLGGIQVVSVQLLEQSPINMDDVLLRDLAMDYAQKLDTFCINNNATGKYGLLNVSGVNAVTYTDASPTVPEIWPKLIDAARQVFVGRYLPAQKIFMTPTRWAWFLSALDSNYRPFVTSAGAAPFNSLGLSEGTPSEGYMGVINGLMLPVFCSQNIPANLGGGSNESRIIVARTDDIYLYEGSPRVETFRETKADQASVLLRFYNYVALQSARYPKSISVISGTGLVTPTF